MYSYKNKIQTIPNLIFVYFDWLIQTIPLINKPATYNIFNNI